MIELPCGLCLRKHHNGVGHLALVAIGRTAAQGQASRCTVFRLTLTLGCEGGGAAAVQINGLHAAQRLHCSTDLRHGHANGIRCLAAVYHHHYHRTVRLNADGCAGCTGRIVKVTAGVAIFKNIAKAGNCLQHITGRNGCITFLRAGDIRTAVFIDPECSAGRLIDHSTAHDKSTRGTPIAHVVAASIDRAHNIGVAAGLHALRLVGCLRHGPVSAGFNGVNVIVTVAHCHRGRGVLADLDLHHMPHHLLCQRCII